MRASIATTIVLAILLIPRIASVARAPDIIQKSFELHGGAARSFAGLLEIPLDRPSSVGFELSQSDEHRALPARDAALRDPSGLLSSELGWRVSTMIRQTASWDPRTGTLRLDGYLADVDTGTPRADGPRFRFTSPWFSKDQLDQVPGWRALYGKLLAIPATRTGTTDLRALEVPLDGGERARAMLYRVDTWDANNQPVEKWFMAIAFGTVATTPVAAPSGGCSH